MSAFWLEDAGTWRKCANAWFNAAGTWLKAKSLWFNDVGTWRKVFVSMMASAAPNSVSGNAGSLTTGAVVTATTGSTTVTPTGGTAPYSYAWAYVSGDTATVNAPSAATTNFSRTGTVPAPIPGVTHKSGVYRCTVTDATGSSASADVSVGTDYYNLT